MKKVEIVKTRNYRGGLGPQNSGDIVEVENGLADQLIEQGCAKSLEFNSKSDKVKKEDLKKIKED